MIVFPFSLIHARNAIAQLRSERRETEQLSLSLSLCTGETERALFAEQRLGATWRGYSVGGQLTVDARASFVLSPRVAWRTVEAAT